MMSLARRLSAFLVIVVVGCHGGSNHEQVKATGEATHFADAPKAGDTSNDTAVDRTSPEPPDASECEGRPVTNEIETDDLGRPLRQTEVVYLDDGSRVAHGAMTYFWPNGDPKTEVTYVCGVRHGPRASWHDNGKLWQQGEYFNNKENGVARVWAYDGTLLQEWTMVHGAWHGTNREWHLNGRLKTQVEWINGKRQGPQIYWAEDGTKIKRIDYHNGVPQPG